MEEVVGSVGRRSNWSNWCLGAGRTVFLKWALCTVFILETRRIDTVITVAVTMKYTFRYLFKIMAHCK